VVVPETDGHIPFFLWLTMIAPNFFISHDEFRVWNPNVDFIKSDDDDAYNSRQIRGIMSTPTTDRQGEDVCAKGLDFNPFLQHGHFNDNHDQATGSIVGYPEEAAFSENLILKGGRQTDGWLCRGYILKGTKKADDIWELAKALSKTPDRRLGFSIEGRVVKRNRSRIEKAIIRNVAITNCPVNTEATWDVLTKSFYDEDIAMKAMSAGFGAAQGPAGQSGGSALGSESLEHDKDKRKKKKTLNYMSYITRSLGLPTEEEFYKACDWVQEFRPDFDDEAAAELVGHILLAKGVRV